MFRSRLLKTALSMLLCVALLVPSTTAFASSTNTRPIDEIFIQIGEELQLDFSYLYEIRNTADSLEADGRLIYDMISGMSSDALAIFLEFLVQNDDMLAFYNTYVDSSAQLELASFAPFNSTDIVLTDLNNRLIAIGLSTTVRTALIGAASSIKAAVLSGPVPVATILAILVAAAFSTVLILNWAEVSRHWSAIVNAFTASFSQFISAANMSNAWAQSRPAHENMANLRGRALSDLRRSPIYNSALRHIESAFVSMVALSLQPVGIYASTVNHRVMFTFRLASPVTADHNVTFAHTNPFETIRNPSLSRTIPRGTMVYLLMNDRGGVFHAHITVNRDDTRGMRFNNSLNVQLAPTVRIEDVFLSDRPNSVPDPFRGNIFSQ